MRLALSVKYEYAPSALSSTASNATYERVRRQRSEPRAEPSDAARHSAVGGDGRRRPAAQPISHAADRLDAVVRGVAELLPQVADVHLDVVLVPEEGVAPHLVEDALARQHLVGVGREIQEQVELARRQLERAFPRAHLARGGVDAEVAGTDDACQLRAAPAEHRPAIGGGADLEALMPQPESDEVGDALLVVDDEDAGGRGHRIEYMGGQLRACTRASRSQPALRDASVGACAPG